MYCINSALMDFISVDENSTRTHAGSNARIGVVKDPHELPHAFAREKRIMQTSCSEQASYGSNTALSGGDRWNQSYPNTVAERPVQCIKAPP